MLPLAVDRHKVLRKGDSWRYILHVMVISDICNDYDKKQLIKVSLYRKVSYAKMQLATLLFKPVMMIAV